MEGNIRFSLFILKFGIEKLSAENKWYEYKFSFINDA